MIDEFVTLRVKGMPDDLDGLPGGEIGLGAVPTLGLGRCERRGLVDLELEDVRTARMIRDEIRATIGLLHLAPAGKFWNCRKLGMRKAKKKWGSG